MKTMARVLRTYIAQALSDAAVAMVPRDTPSTVVHIRTEHRGDQLVSRVEIVSPTGVEIHDDEISHPLRVNPDVPLILEHSRSL